jgi:hypothetical protein
MADISSTNNSNQKFSSSTCCTSLELSDQHDDQDSTNDSRLHFVEDFVDRRIDHDHDENDVAYEMALQKRTVLMKRRQQRYLVTAALLLVVSLLLGFLALFFRKKPTIIMPFSSSLWMETTLPSSGRLISSVSLSEDGLVAASADGIGLLVWQQRQRPGAGCEAHEDHTMAAQWVALSGDGQLLALATPVHNGTHLRVTSSTNILNNEEPIASYYYPNTYVITDLALDRNGTTLAVGYGRNGTTIAEYDMGGVDLYNRRYYDDETPDPDHQKQQFPTNFQSDNGGMRVQINADGTRAVHSTEHSPYDRSASLLYQDYLDMGNWYGIQELFRLGNTSACDNVTSDVGISSDGSIVVVALLCGQKKKEKQGGTTTKVYVYTYREVGGLYPENWTPLTDQPLTRSLAVDTHRRYSYHHNHKMVPFSIALSGDASTLVLATPDVLEVLQWNWNSSNSSSSSSSDNSSLAVVDAPYWQTLNQWKEDNGNGGVEYLPALSSDGSRLFLARNDVAGGTGSLRYLDLWAKRNDTDRGYC